jgi:hypothetical protein
MISANQEVRSVSQQLEPAQDRGVRAPCELIDSKELATRWRVPESWIRDAVRSRAADKIPHVRFGKYIRFEWNCPDLNTWLARRRCCKKRA